MSRFILGDCVQVMSRFPTRAVDFILTDPPYLVGYKDRTGRTLAGDNTNDSLMVSFYAWNRADLFLNAWKTAGFRIVGHIVFAKSYTSKSTFVGYAHESAYLLAKGRPQTPDRPIPDVLPWKYTGNRHHPTEKPVQSLCPLIESLTRPGAIVLDPFAGSGSTCVAADEASRRYIGIEMLEQYHAAGVRRLAQVERARRMPAANDAGFYPDYPEAA